MLGRISRGISHASGGKRGAKYKISILVEKLDNLPAAVKRCRVVWSRGPKVQMTAIKDVTKGAVTFKQQLTQIATMFKDANEDFEPKEYKFQVQVPSKEGDGKLMTIGKADLDLSYFMVHTGQPQNKLVPMIFKVGAASTGYLKVLITAEPVSGGIDDEDGMTEVSALTGMTAHLDDDQDLSGFDVSGQQESPKPGCSPSVSAHTRLGGLSPTPPAVENPRTVNRETPPSKGSSKVASSSKAKQAPTAADDNGDISPMSMSSEESPGSSPRESIGANSRGVGKHTIVTAQSATAAASKPDNQARSELFKAGSVKGRRATGTTQTSSSKDIQQLTEDEARSELFSAGPRHSTANSNKTATASSSKGAPGNSNTPRWQAAAPAAAAVTSSAAIRPSVVPSRPPSTNYALSVSSAGGSTSGGGGHGGTLTLGDGLHRTLLERPGAPRGKDLGAATAAAAFSTRPQAGDVARAAAAGNQSLDEEAPDAMGVLEPIITRSKTAIKESTKSQPRTRPGTPVLPASAATRSASPEACDLTSTQVGVENERLKAQLVALRDQAAQAEDARQQACMAAEDAAAERDEYKSQVQELEQQLKEVISASLSTDEAQELMQQVKALQEQQHNQTLTNHHHQQDPTKLKVTNLQLQSSAGMQEMLQKEASVEQLQLYQYKTDCGCEQLQQQELLRQTATKQSVPWQQQLQDVTDSAVMADGGTSTSGVLECKQQLVAELETQLAQQEQKAVTAQQQHAGIMALLLAECHQATQVQHVRCLLQDSQLVESVRNRVALSSLALDFDTQEDLQHLLLCLKAAITASMNQAEKAAQLQDQLTAQSAAVEMARSSLHPAEVYAIATSNLPLLEQSIAVMEQRITGLEAETDQAKPYNQQLLHKQQQRNGLPGRLEWSMLEPVMVKEGVQWARTEVNPGAAAVECTDPQEHLAQLTQQLANAQRKVKQLTQAQSKLEIILADFEAVAAEEKQHFIVQLSAANQQARQAVQQLHQLQQDLATSRHMEQMLNQDLKNLEVALVAAELTVTEADGGEQLLQHAVGEAQAASCSAVAASEKTMLHAATKVIASADGAIASSSLQESLILAQEQVSELQRQLAEAQIIKRAAGKELGRLRKQLSEEQAERTALEEQVAQQLQDTGDYTAQDTAAAYEAKYNGLKRRYHELTASHRDEVDGLHAEIRGLQERVVSLEAAAAQLDAARAQTQCGEATLADALIKSSKAGTELVTLRAENQQLMQSLVSAKMELAQLGEREVVCRRELYKAKETNMKLARKMTQLETLVYK